MRAGQGLQAIGLCLLLGLWPLEACWAKDPRPPVGLWLKHAWMDQTHSSKELRALAARLVRNGVTHVFVHIGPYNAKGLLKRYKPESVRAWLGALRRFAPGVKRLAWLGGRASKEGGTFDLDSAAYRRAVIQETSRLLRRFAFDGIHLNIEPLEEDNPNLLELIRGLRKALGKGKILSFAGPRIRPWWLPGILGLSERAWRKEAFLPLLPLIDQLVVMVYDTALPSASLYQRYVASHAIALREVYREAGRPNCQLLVGLPTYEEASWLHRPEVENLEQGLIGLLRGISISQEPDSPTIGVSLYANWTTSEAEWETFRLLWLKRFGPET